jgi:hypothetical protein
MNGRAIVMENRSGAGTFIPMQAVAQAPADGHTPALASEAVLATAPVMPLPRHHERDRVVDLLLRPLLGGVEVAAPVGLAALRPSDGAQRSRR